ncbi:MAG: NigD-like protein [Bacteroidales bacterium]
MKKIKLFLLLAVLTAPFLQSCNDKIDQPSQYALVTIKTTAHAGSQNSYYGILDNDDKIYVGNNRVGNYKPIDGQRALMYFTPLETPVAGYKYNADVYYVENILTKPTILLNDKQYDTLGTDNISITRAWIGGDYLNIEFAVITNGVANHIINLVDNQLEKLEQLPGYITLDLRHNSKNIHNGQLSKAYACFKLDMYNPAESGEKGLYIRYKPVYGEEIKYLKVNIGTEASGE